MAKRANAIFDRGPIARLDRFIRTARLGGDVEDYGRPVAFARLASQDGARDVAAFLVDDPVLIEKTQQRERWVDRCPRTRAKIVVQLDPPLFERKQHAIDVTQSDCPNLEWLRNVEELVPQTLDLWEVLVKAPVGSQSVEGEALQAYLDDLLLVVVKKEKSRTPLRPAGCGNGASPDSGIVSSPKNCCLRFGYSSAKRAEAAGSSATTSSPGGMSQSMSSTASTIGAFARVGKASDITSLSRGYYRRQAVARSPFRRLKASARVSPIVFLCPIDRDLRSSTRSPGSGRDTTAPPRGTRSRGPIRAARPFACASRRAIPRTP